MQNDECVEFDTKRLRFHSSAEKVFLNLSL